MEKTAEELIETHFMHYFGGGSDNSVHYELFKPIPSYKAIVQLIEHFIEQNKEKHQELNKWQQKFYSMETLCEGESKASDLYKECAEDLELKNKELKEELERVNKENIAWEKQWIEHNCHDNIKHLLDQFLSNYQSLNK